MSDRLVKPSLVLASSSPRRRELLAILGLPFRWVAPPEDVDTPADGFEDAAESLAREKALAVAHSLDSGFVIAADTLVIFEGRALGKPSGPEAARDCLRKLKGREHSVITGVAAVDAGSGQTISNHTMTRVWMRHYSEDEIERYVASGDPLDKAGAYAIQGLASKFIDRIEGDFANVVGLPVYQVYWYFKKLKNVVA